ncbi:hypothetical protein [Saliphagus sp. LR7]|uniref:hypothetical protein n=1 Tax=Saliphagus sp. LR7 TaxID=2282654 RepID=UPI000DF73FE8|nr:hypothetical protein [Saliphagus sp. LR7]
MTADRSDELEIEIERAERSDRDARGSDREPPERRLEDELGRIDLSTTPEGYVEGRVAAIESLDSRTVRLEVALPHGPRVGFDLEKPIPWSEEFLLARIVDDVGYDAASVGHLRGETVYLARTDAGDEGGSRWRAWLPEDSLAALPPAVRDPIDRLLAAGSPRWRLVDPAERPSPTDGTDGVSAATATGAVVVGAVLAALGAAVGAAGGLAVPTAAVAAALPGLVLVVAGLAVLLARG